MHSFWVPQLAGKTDLLPNRVNEMWIDPRMCPECMWGNARSSAERSTRRCCCGCMWIRRSNLRRGSGISSRCRRIAGEHRDRKRGRAFKCGSRKCADGECCAEFRRSGCEDRATGVRASGLYELPHDQGDGGEWTLWAGSDAPDEPGYDRRGRHAEHATEFEAWITDPNVIQAGMPDAGDAFDRANRTQQITAYLLTLTLT